MVYSELTWALFHNDSFTLHLIGLRVGVALRKWIDHWDWLKVVDMTARLSCLERPWLLLALARVETV